MGRFLTKLQLEQLEEGTPFKNAKYKVLSPLIYESKTLKTIIIVPEGFITDLASIPRIPILYALLGGLGNAAAVVHDFLYTYPHKPSKDSTITVDRKTADKILKGIVIQCMWENFWSSSTLFKNMIFACIGIMFYIGVRLAGSRHWKDAE